MMQSVKIRPNVLLVDDDKRILDALQRSMRKEPYNVLYAVNPSHAADIASKISIDILVTDYEMPGMNGLELLHKFRKYHPQTVSIMLTGKGSLEIITEALNQAEVYKFFTKPCDSKKILDAIREGLKHSEYMSASRSEIDKLRENNDYLLKLEKESPGITVVNRDSRGAIILEE